MKVFKMVLIIFAVIIVVLSGGVFFFLKTVDINKYRSTLVSKIRQAINREVSIDKLGFSFSLNKGVWLNVSGFSIADIPDYQENPLIKVQSLDLHLDILALLTKKEIVISGINIKSPDLVIVRSATGEINLKELARQKPESKSPRALAAQEPSRTEPQSEEPSFKVLIKSIKLADGRMTFIDKSFNPPVNFVLKDLDVMISNFSLTSSFSYELSGSLWSNQKNIQLKGKAKIDPNNEQVRVDDLTTQLNMESLNIDELNKGLPVISPIGLYKKAEGKVIVDVRQMILGKTGPLVLSVETSIENGKLWLSPLTTPVEYINGKIEMTESDILVNTFSMAIASGNVNFNGRLSEYLKERTFLIKSSLSDIKIDELIDPANLPARMEGRIYGKLDGKGQALNETTLKESLDMAGGVDLKGGRIVDFNLLQFVLNKIPFPNLAGILQQQLPETARRYLTQKDTIINQFHIDTQFIKDSIVLKQVILETDGALLTANGKIDFDQNIELEAALAIPKDLSADIVASAGELSALLNTEGRLFIPLKPYKGKLRNIIMYPNVEQIIKQGGKEQLKKAIFKALKVDDESQPADPNAAPNERPSAPEKEIIENILDRVFN